MTPRGRVAGAALGLLLLAAPLGVGPGRAQTTTTTTTTVPTAVCPTVAEAAEVDRIRYERLTPPETPSLVDAKVDVGATFQNVAAPLGPRQPELERVDGRIVACDDEQFLPSEAAKSIINPDDVNRPLTLSWSPVFQTNGTYAIVFDARGRRPTGVTTDASQERQAVQHITLAVPPKQPTEVAVSDPSNGVVKISWDYDAPEPDLAGFEVRRARQGSGDFRVIDKGTVAASIRSVSDAPPVGTWRYQVAAFRNGVDEPAVSRETPDDTVEVSAPPPASATSATIGATPGSGTSTGTDGGTTVDGSTTSLAPGSGAAPRASVDLSDFAATLNARRRVPAPRIEPPDPGFQETLPFDPRGQLEVDEEEPEELGGDEPNVGLGQRPVSDPGERRRSIGFVAFGLLLFVLSMTGLFLKSEVKRADLLDLDAVPDADADAAVAPGVVVPPAVAGAAATRRARRRRAAVPDVPVPDEPAAAPVRRPRRPAPVRAVVAAPAVAAAAVAAAPVGGGRRRSPDRMPAPEPIPSRRRPAATASTIDFPETRRRWTGWPTERPNGKADGNGHAGAPAHDFDDLVPTATAAGTAAAAPATRRRPHPPAMPLDAPGLDVPDPTPLPTRTRTKPTARATTARR